MNTRPRNACPRNLDRRSDRETAEQVLAHVVTLKVEEEKPAEVVATEGVTPAEPEVIKKGKKEVEGEEGAEGEAKQPKAAEKSDKGDKEKKK